MKIRIIGKTGKHNKEYVHLFDGYENSNDEFSEYFGDDEECLIEKGVCGGYMSFEVIDGVLHTITTYNLDQPLTDSEIEILKEYTQGQWSDGIGEGFEQFPNFQTESGKELFVSPWYPGQTLGYEYVNK